MLIDKCRFLEPFTSLRPSEGSTFLPFLYRTKTIARGHGTTSHESDHRGLKPGRRETPSEDNLNRQRNAFPRSREGSNRPDQQQRETRRLPRTSVRSARVTTVPHHRFTSERNERPRSGLTARQQTLTLMPNRTPRERGKQHIPLDDKQEERSQSTLTTREMRIFEKLWEKRINSGTKQKPAVFPANSSSTESKVSCSDTTPDDNLDVQHSQRLDSSDEEAEQHDIDADSALLQSRTLRASLDRYKGMMRDAPNDVEVWSILDAYVFKRLKSLALAENAHGKPKKGDSEAKHNLGISNQIFRIALPLYINYPLKLLRTKFPGSPLALEVLPALQRIGPSAFALAASTPLFNERLQVYRDKSDIDGVVATLDLMDKEAHEFDQTTLTVIESILATRDRAVTGALGGGSRALWQTDRKLSGLKKLESWRSMVDRRLHEKALRKARDEEALREIEQRDDQATTV